MKNPMAAYIQAMEQHWEKIMSQPPTPVTDVKEEIASELYQLKRQQTALQSLLELMTFQLGLEFLQGGAFYIAQMLNVHFVLITKFTDESEIKVQTLVFLQGEKLEDNFEYDIMSTPCQTVLSTGEPCYYLQNVINQFPQEVNLLTKFQLESYLGMPLMNSQGKILGHLVAADRKPMGLSAEAKWILNLMAARAGLELERHLATERLKKAKEEADAANQAKSQYLANMSHELRTPLSAILGFTQLISRDASVVATHQEQLGIISRSGEHLLSLINDVLEMSKIEAGRITLNQGSFDLYRLLEGLEEMLKIKAASKGLQLIFKQYPPVPQYITTDEGKLRQVLINLLGNGIKFTQEGSVILRIKAPNPGVLAFEVEDTGPGIAPNELNTLFNAFVQTQTGQISQEGSGLGLLISRQFVRLMGGDITVRSILGQGTLFQFEIRAHPAEAKDTPPLQPVQRVIGLAPGQLTYRILVVDDHPENTHLMVSLLAPLGFEVREAQNGQEAVDIWGHWHPHLIWMDIRMPQMDGYEAAKRIKATTQGQTTVIIALTASVFEEEATQVLSAGCDDFVRQPFREAVIFEKMTKYLGVRYIYEQPNLIKAPEEDYSEENLVFHLSQMPLEWVKQLEKAAIELDDPVILELIQQIPPESVDLTQALTQWVNNFRLDKITNLVELMAQ